MTQLQLDLFDKNGNHSLSTQSINSLKEACELFASYVTTVGRYGDPQGAEGVILQNNDPIYNLTVDSQGKTRLARI